MFAQHFLGNLGANPTDHHLRAASAAGHRLLTAATVQDIAGSERKVALQGSGALVFQHAAVSQKQVGIQTIHK